MFREPAENALRDYVKIVKFNDLNLWNIKVSSQKAHTHLYKIIRKFREAVGAQVQPIFDKLVQMDSASVAVLPDLSEVKADGRGRRAVELANTIMAKGSCFFTFVVENFLRVGITAAAVCDITAAVELADQTKCCDEAIRVLINYQGEDEEKEKQQGYARNSRQRAVAMVIKEAQSIGLNARKAQALDQETVTRSSLTEVKRHRANETSVHKCAGGRNVCIRKAVAPNDQLGVATRKHLVGVIDYGMAWILKCHRKLADWEELCNVLTRKTRAFERLESNMEAGWFVDYERLKSQWEFIHTRTEEVVRHTEAMSKRLSRVDCVEITTTAVSTDNVLLFIQNLYKSVVESTNTGEMRLMDRFDFALNAMTGSAYEKEITPLLHVVTQLFSAMNCLVSSSLQAFASLYYALLSMSMQLFEK
ncbi:hypothetical protein OSTOST_11699, partial [Ostertagia ostertagi]